MADFVGGRPESITTALAIMARPVAMDSGLAGLRPRPGMTSLARERPLLLLRRLDRILDVREGGKFDVVELAALLLDFADVDVLDDVAGVRIDRDRAARAFPGQAFGGGDE